MQNKGYSSVVSAELLGPIFKIKNVTVQQTLYNNNTNRKLRLLATFVPDELIMLIEQKNKLIQHQLAIILLIDISELHSYFDEFFHAQNNGSHGLSQVFDLYTSTIIEQICFSQGDVLKFTETGILSIWKQNENELIHVVMRKVISCSLAIKKAIQNLKSDLFDFSRAHMKIAISAGSITFSIIGEGDIRYYVIAGEPVASVRKAVGLSLPDDLILAESAWEHCVLSDYVYVIQDQSHIKKQAG